MKKKKSNPWNSHKWKGKRSEKQYMKNIYSEQLRNPKQHCNIQCYCLKGPKTAAIKARNTPITAVGAKMLPILVAAGPGDMAIPGVWSWPSWAETTMISNPKHAAQMTAVTADAIFSIPKPGATMSWRMDLNRYN